jgi:hypothetical protein
MRLQYNPITHLPLLPLLLLLLLRMPCAVEWAPDQQLHLLACALHDWLCHLAHRTRHPHSNQRQQELLLDRREHGALL